MAYTKTTWVTNETALSADNMNHIEDGIKNLEDNMVFPLKGTKTEITSLVTNNEFFTAPVSGWMVATAQNDSGLEMEAYMDILNEQGVMNSAWGSKYSQGYIRVAAPITAGKQYKIYATRCTLTVVMVYQ